MDWNYRQKAPLTDIYAAFNTILTFINDIVIALTNYGIISINNNSAFIISNSISIVLVFIVSLGFCVTFSSSYYWMAEKIFF